MKRLVIIAALDEKGGIGKEGKIPWELGTDTRYFRNITCDVRLGKNALIMGRKTRASISFPLHNRKLFVVGSSCEYKSLGAAITAANADEEIETIFLIGGSRIYKEGIALEPDIIHLTRIYCDFSCDTWFPKFDVKQFNQVSSGIRRENQVLYQFISFFRRHEENQYLNLVKRVLIEGKRRTDRTGVGTLSVFGAQMRFSLKSFPLLTTKNVFFRGVAEELFWFISGSTNSKDLSAKGVKIWDENGSRAFLDKCGFTDRKEGDLGPIYSHQFRRWGASYPPTDDEKSIDQLSELIKQIKETPDSRRLVLSAWNPTDIPKMALPPCHCLAQFYVDMETKELSCHLYQRSGDLGLGVPFNIASYALLTTLLAHVCNLTPGTLYHSLGDVHIYLNHVEGMKEQITRRPYPFPTLKISNRTRDLFKLSYADLLLSNYQHHPSIKLPMAV